MTDRFIAQNSHAAHVRDRFPLSSHFSIDFGVRWDYFGILHARHSLFSLYDPARGLIIPKQLYRRDLNNFAPRLSLIWDISNTHTTVLSAGAGLYYDALPSDIFVGQIQFNTFVPGIAYNAIPPAPVLSSRSPISVLQVGVPVFASTTFSADTRDAWTVGTIRTPYVLNYNMNLQEELFKNTHLRVAYVGSAGRKLSRVQDINAPFVPGGARPFDHSAVLSAVAPNKPFIVDRVDTSATSSYNSLEVSYNQDSWHQWSNIVSWTWSHAIDDASYGLDLFPNQSSPANPYAPKRERASSDFDARQRVGWNTTYTFDLPSSTFPERLRKGWRIGGDLILRSGTPYHISFGREFDTTGAYDFILRPDLVGNPFLGTASPFRFLNLAAFQVPCTLDGTGTDVSHCLPGTLHFGNLPRNAFTGPGLASLDITLAKTTKLSERWSFEVRADLFNVTNHPNFASPFLPHFIGTGDAKGIDLSGKGGAAGTQCNTRLASTGCYLSLTTTPDSANGSPFRATGGPRTAQISVKLAF